MLQITRKADYAVRLMVEVAAHSGESVTTAEIAESQAMPYQFLRKVAQVLSAKGLLASERGGRRPHTCAAAGNISFWTSSRRWTCRSTIAL